MLEHQFWELSRNGNNVWDARKKRPKKGNARTLTTSKHSALRSCSASADDGTVCTTGLPTIQPCPWTPPLLVQHVSVLFVLQLIWSTCISSYLWNARIDDVQTTTDGVLKIEIISIATLVYIVYIYISYYISWPHGDIWFEECGGGAKFIRQNTKLSRSFEVNL